MKIYLITLLLFIGCGTDQEINTRKKQNSMELTNCIEILKNDSISFNSNLDLSNCDLNSLLSAFGLNEVDSMLGRLGTNQTPLSWWTVNNKDVEITFWAQSGELVKIDVTRDFDSAKEIEIFKNKNGEPNSTLDYYFDVLLMKDKTAVYPDIGIALFYGMDDSSVFKWSYFNSITSMYYEENLHPVNAPREFEGY